MSSIAMAADSTQSELKEDLKCRKKKKKEYEEKRKKKTFRKTKMGRRKHVADEDTSDHDSDLDLSRPLLPIGGYIKDREEMTKHMFQSIRTKKLKAMLPEILRPLSRDELKALCVEELEYMSKKRIGRILDGADPDSISSSGSEEESSLGVLDNDEEEEPAPADVVIELQKEKGVDWVSEDDKENANEKLIQDENENQEESISNDGHDFHVVSGEGTNIPEVDEEGTCRELEETHDKAGNLSDNEGSEWTGSLASSPPSSLASSRAASPSGESRDRLQVNKIKKYGWSSEEEGEIRSDHEAGEALSAQEDNDQPIEEKIQCVVQDETKNEEVESKEIDTKHVLKNLQMDSDVGSRGKIIQPNNVGESTVSAQGSEKQSVAGFRSATPVWFLREIDVQNKDKTVEKETKEANTTINTVVQLVNAETDSIQCGQGSEVIQADSTCVREVLSPICSPREAEKCLGDQVQKKSPGVLNEKSNEETYSSAGCEEEKQISTKSVQQSAPGNEGSQAVGKKFVTGQEKVPHKITSETEGLDSLCQKQDSEHLPNSVMTKTVQDTLTDSTSKSESRYDSSNPTESKKFGDNVDVVPLQQGGKHGDLVSDTEIIQPDDICMISAEIGSDIDNDLNGEEESSSNCTASSPADSSDSESGLSSDDGISISVQGVCITVGQEGDVETLQFGTASHNRVTEASKRDHAAPLYIKDKVLKVAVEENKKEERKCPGNIGKNDEKETVGILPNCESISKKKTITVKRPIMGADQQISAEATNAKETTNLQRKSLKIDQKAKSMNLSLINTTEPKKERRDNSQSVEKRTTLIRISQDKRIIKREPEKALSTDHHTCSEIPRRPPITKEKAGTVSSNLGDLKISIGSIGDRRIIQLDPQGRGEHDDSQPVQGNQRIITESTSQSVVSTRVLLKRKTDKKSLTDDKVSTSNMGPSHPKKMTLDSVPKPQAVVRQGYGEAPPQPMPRTSGKARKIKIKSATKEQQPTQKKIQPDSCLENIDKELGDLVKKGASSDVNVSITQSQMEILELEMRARAIKAMLKAQDEQPMKQEATNDNNLSSGKPSQMTSTTSAPKAKHIVKHHSRRAIVKSTISVDPVISPERSQKKTQLKRYLDHPGHTEQHENKAKVVGKQYKPKSVVCTVPSVAKHSVSVKTDGPSTIQQKLSMMAGYPKAVKSDGGDDGDSHNQRMSEKRKHRSSERYETSASGLKFSK